MKTVSHVSLFISVLSLFVFSSGCKKNDNPDNSNRPPVVFNDVNVIASLQGKVLDENNRPAANVIVKAGNSSTTTDLNGVFYFKNIELGKNAGTVSVEKTGYFKTNRTFITNPGSVNYVEIQLIPKTDKGSFSSLSGGTINIDNGSYVTFAANSIVNSASNSLYSGNVKVKGKYLDPEDPALTAIMPGNLTGIDTTKQLKLLQTYGMIAIELEGSSNEKLNIAPGQTASITMPIAAAMVADAPARIPLWFFNDTTGLWVEQGFAIKQGNNYVGTVSHFTFWNCDRPYKLITLKLTLKDQNGNPLRFYRVDLINKQNSSSSSGYTDSSGTVNGGVPLDVTLQMEVFDRCGTKINTQIIGPFSTSTDMGTITVNTTSGNITIMGNAVNCGLSSLSNGLLAVKLEGLTYSTPVTNGNFSLTIQRCNTNPTSLQISAIDFDANKSMDTTLYNATSGIYNTGTLKVCGQPINEYINFVIDGSPTNFVSFLSAQRGGAVTQILRSSDNGTSSESAGFTFDGGTAPGTYSIKGYIYVNTGHKIYTGATDTPIIITEYGNVGGYVMGSFDGNVKDSSTSAIVPITCKFRVKRVE